MSMSRSLPGPDDTRFANRQGLERPAVVLSVNESEPRDRSREKPYVGMSRATDQLIVVGEPDHVRQIGGPEVARRLGLEGGNT